VYRITRCGDIAIQSLTYHEAEGCIWVPPPFWRQGMS